MIVDLVLGVLDRLGMAIDKARLDERAWKEADPCKAAMFHGVMFDTYRPIRWIPRLHHARWHRYWAARCTAEQRSNCALIRSKAADLIREQRASE